MKSQETPARLAAAASAGWGRVVRFFMGEDFFISYGRADGSAYAAALALHLVQRRHTCFLDQWQPIVDADIPPPIRRALMRASTLVVIGSPAAARSVPVATEVSLFTSTGRPIIPIDFAGSLKLAAWAGGLTGIALSTEPSQALVDGAPSQGVVDRLVNTFRFRRRSMRLRVSLGSFAAGSVLLAAVSLWFAAEATRATQLAKDQTLAAQEAASAANAERMERERQAGLARASALQAEQQASAAAARGRLADSRALAIGARSQELTVDQRLLVAAQAWQLDANPQAMDALQTALMEAGHLSRVFYSARPARTGEVVGVGIRAGGGLAVAGFADGTLGMWKWETGALRTEWSSPRTGPGASPRATSAALAEDGTWAAIGYADGGVELLKVGPTGFGLRTPLRVSSPLGPVSSALRPFAARLVFSPTGRVLVVGWSDGRVQAFNIATGEVEAVFGDPFDAIREPHRGGTLAVTFSDDGARLATSHGGATLRIWKADESFAADRVIRTEDDCNSLVFHVSGQSLICATGARGAVRLVPLQAGDARATSNVLSTGAWTNVARVGEGATIALLPLHGPLALSSAGADGFSAMQQIGPRLQHAGGVLAAARRSPEVVVGLPDGTVHLYDAQRAALSLPLVSRQAPRWVTFDSAGRWVLGAGEYVTAWRDLNSNPKWEHPAPWSEPRVHPLTIDLNDDGLRVHASDLSAWRCVALGCSRVALARSDSTQTPWQDSESGGPWLIGQGGAQKLCDPAGCRPVPSNVPQWSAARRYALAKHGALWAFATDREVRLCYGERCRTAPGLEPDSEGWVSGVAFTPAGDRLVVATSDGRIRFISTEKGTDVVPARTAHRAAAVRIVFDARGLRMATGGRDGTVVRWDLASMSPVGSPLPRRGGTQIRDLALAPGGDELVVLHSDGAVLRHDLRPASMLSRACSIAGRDLSVSEWQAIAPGAECRRACGTALSACPQGEVRATTVQR